MSFLTTLHSPSVHASSTYSRKPLRRFSSCFKSNQDVLRLRTGCDSRKRCRASPIRAEQEQSDEERQEALLERREKNARRRRDSSAYRDAQRTQREQVSKSGKPLWPEGQLFPDGWNEMSVFGKAWQIYAGERGLLFWANKAAYISVFVIVGGWILFRVVGPALGLYKLTNDISTPTKY